MPHVYGAYTYTPLPSPLLPGRPRQVGDLRRILEGYVHWQKRIFPSLSFVEFIEKVEKLGSKRSVQVGDWVGGWASGWVDG